MRIKFTAMCICITMMLAGCSEGESNSSSMSSERSGEKTVLSEVLSEAENILSEDADVLEAVSEPSSSEQETAAEQSSETAASALESAPSVTETEAASQAPVIAVAPTGDTASVTAPQQSMHTTSHVIVEHNHENVSSAGIMGLPPEETQGDNLVWIPTDGGAKYHSNAYCSEMYHPITVSLETAVAYGFDSCGKCFRGTIQRSAAPEPIPQAPTQTVPQVPTQTAPQSTQERLVWVPTEGGKKYHRTAGCSSMDGPVQIPVDEAVAAGFTPCKRCKP